MKETITQNAPMLICCPIKRVPLQKLMKNGFVKKSCDANSNENTSEEDRASLLAIYLGL